MSRELCVPISVVGNESVREVFVSKKRKKIISSAFGDDQRRSVTAVFVYCGKVSETVAKYCGKRKRIVK